MNCFEYCYRVQKPFAIYERHEITPPYGPRGCMDIAKYICNDELTNFPSYVAGIGPVINEYDHFAKIDLHFNNKTPNSRGICPYWGIEGYVFKYEITDIAEIPDDRIRRFSVTDSQRRYQSEFIKIESFSMNPIHPIIKWLSMNRYTFISHRDDYDDEIYVQANNIITGIDVKFVFRFI